MNMQHVYKGKWDTRVCNSFFFWWAVSSNGCTII